MTSSGSSSTRRRIAGLCAVLGLVACASGQAGRRGGEALSLRSRIAVFPTLSLIGGAAPVKRFSGPVEQALRARGIEVVDEAELQAFLARHRVRYTGGLDAPTALAIREELGVEAVAIASVDLYSPVGVPRFGMTLRLVSTEEEPSILWMDGWARAGDDSPGLFGLGVTSSIEALEGEALGQLTRSLASFLETRRPPDRCPTEGRLQPRLRYRHPLRPTEGVKRVAVLPLHNESARRDAGEVVALQLVKHLAATGAFRVLEPGVVRSDLLRFRVVMEGGVTYEAARVALGAQRVDVVIAGTVYAYGDKGNEFTVTAIETWDNRVVWESRSSGRGEPRVMLFGLGRLSTAEAVACAMARGVVDEMSDAWGEGGRSGRSGPQPGGAAPGPSADASGSSGRTQGLRPPGVASRRRSRKHLGKSAA